VYCRACTEQLLQEQAAGVPAGAPPAAVIDPTICSRCNADNGNSEFALVGQLPFCQPCRDYLYSNPYPKWLKAGLAVLLVLLVIALVHGRQYFQVGRDMYIGEKLVEQTSYAEAIPHLQLTVKVAPHSNKAVLLLAKAALLNGNPDIAYQAVRGHDNEKGFEEDTDFREVDNLFAHAASALDKAKKASELALQPGKAAEAATLMRQASAEYPQMKVLQDAVIFYDGGVAFEKKDYDLFLKLSQQGFEANPDSTEAAGVVASALACKYAVTGDVSWKQKTEEMLEKARQLSHRTPEDAKAFEEYTERTRYRLTSREIIDKPEYDRRFRSANTTKN
jgi:tetratricopeptide (TPR) repeat protein